MIRLMWWLLRALLTALAFMAAVLMLRPLWRLVPGDIRRIIRNVLAVVFIVLGLIGWLLPVMPGFVFWLLALLVLDLPQKRMALRRLQHSWLVRKLLQRESFAKSWRILRRYARGDLPVTEPVAPACTL